MQVRLQPRCCASADALTVAGVLHCGRGTAALALATVSAIVFVLAIEWLTTAFGGKADVNGVAVGSTRSQMIP
jgi:hypothetical protein